MLEKVVKSIDFATKNFLLLSVSLLVTYSVLGWEFTTFYLSAFDSSLPNFIQYGDIPSISAISLTVFAPTVFGVVFAAIAYGTHRGFGVKWKLIFLVAGLVTYISPVIYDFSHLDRTGLTTEEFLALNIPYVVLISSAILITLFPKILSSIIPSVFFIGAVSITCTGIYGYGTGMRTKRASYPKYDIILKKEGDERRSIIGAKLILSLSHHTMFYIDGKSVIVQTPDIEQMTVRRPEIE